MVKNISDGSITQDKQDSAITPQSQEKAIVQNPQETKDVIRDNGPRIVGAMKLVPDVFLFRSGLRDTGNSPFRSAAAIGFMTSRLLLLRYGSKDRAKDPNQPDSPYKDDKSFTGKLKHNMYKVAHPNQYPVESGAGVAALAGVSVALSGAAQMRRKPTFIEGAIELGVGIFTALAEGNVLFSKEKTKPAHTETAANKPDSLIQKLKDQPVLLSGITQAIASGSQIILGLLTLSRSKKEAAPGKSKSWYYLAAASIYTAADLIYAFFVRKNEFNTEASKAPATERQEQTLPAEPVKDQTAHKPNWQQSVQPSATKDNNLALS